MLVLGRREGERIVLRTEDGKVIEILVVRAANGKAKLGIEAPDDVEILRDELVKNGRVSR